MGGIGKPILPVVPATVVLPDGYTLDHVKVIPGKKMTLPGTHTVEHGQQQYPLLSDIVPTITPGDPAIYSSDSVYPGKLYDVVGVQKQGGVSLVLANLHPVEYKPLSGQVSYYETLTLKVVNDLEDKKSNVRYHSGRARLLSGFVDNPEMLGSYKELGKKERVQRSFVFCNPAESYRYVLITSEDIRDAGTDYTVHDLIAHRRNQGVSANIVTIEDVYANFSGTDGAEQLRNFITEAYNNWETEFVLLGGDINIIPMRKLWCQGGGYTEDIPSDLYYQCLDGNYNWDRDNRWGEPTDGENGGEVDLLAEVYIGRASAENPEEMANFVYKTLTYENDRSAYKRRALLCGELLWEISDTWAKEYMEEVRSGASAHGYTTSGFAREPSYIVDTLYEKDRDWGRNSVISEINSDSYSIINHLGHSDYNYVMKMYNSHADTLGNSKFIFGYSQGCIPGNFEEDCIGEHLTTSTRHGMFAVVYNSRYGWGEHGSTDGASQRYNREFWDAYFREGFVHLGRLNADSHEDNAWRINGDYMRWCYYESNLLGDPMTSLSAEISENTPPVADAGHDQTVKEGERVTLDGSASYDSDGSVTSYSWEQTGGSDVRLSNNAAMQTTFTAPEMRTGGESLSFRLTVTDNNGTQDTDSCNVTVSDQNMPPIADAGPDRTVQEGYVITLDGSDSTDPDGSITSYLWEQTAGLAVTLSNTTTPQARFAAPDAGTTEEPLTFQLTVTDDSGLQDTDTCIVNVTFPVYFPDENLEATIREAINKPKENIMVSDLQNLTYLDASEKGIQNLEGLQFLTNLAGLNLDSNQISDVSPLAGLNNLTVLDLDNNQINDVSPLAGLNNLTGLSLGNNQINDVSPLAGLKNLTWLELWRNQITYVGPLASLTNLTGLSLSGNQINDINPIATLTELTWLVISDSQINDITPLANLSNLTYLYLSVNQISNVRPLSNLKNLMWLHLNGNQISDINPLTSLDNIIMLNISYNHISDIGLISRLNSLTNLRLSGNQIIDISPLAGLTNLTKLDLHGTQISDISPISGLNNLAWLVLSSNQINDISPLTSLNNLTELRISYNQISDISPISRLNSLTNLTLSGNQISDISSLAGLNNLTELLDLHSNQISDISPLAGLNNLMKLHLYGNQISDVSPLTGLNNLKQLYLYYDSYGGNPLSTTSCTVYIPQLESRGVAVYHDCP